MERAEKLREAGLKATSPRMIILEELELDKSHPTAEELYDRLREKHASLSRSTVYQTLETFVRTGLCRRVPAGGGRLRVDGTTQDHDHAVCRVCGTIFDVDRDCLPLPPAPSRLPNGLRVTGLHLEYEVICNVCSDKSNLNAERSAGTTAGDKT